MKHTSYFLLLVMVVASVVVSCGSETGDEPSIDIDDLVEQGAAALGDGDGYRARDIFRRALVEDAKHPQANLGLVLADVQQVLHFLDEIILFVGDMAGGMGLAQTDDGGLEPGDSIDATLHHFLKGIFEPLVDEMMLAMIYVRADESVLLEVPSYPLGFSSFTLIDLHGQWDASDAAWLAGTLNLAQGAIDIIQGTNMDMNLGLLLDTDFVGNLLNGREVDVAATLGELVDVLLAIMQDAERADFLMPLDGEQWRYERAQRNLAMAVYEWVCVWSMIEEETDDPADDVLTYLDANGNGRRESSERFAWTTVGFDPAAMDMLPAWRAMGWDLFAALAERTDLDPYPQTYNTFDLSLANMLLESIGLPALIDSQKLDFADMVENPPNAELKAFLIDALECAEQLDDPAAMLTCFSALLS
ncbi:MAG TPA: hypothetical protein PKW95_16535 [bacterium]|nr:hypothetical protein [bacterium]